DLDVLVVGVDPQTPVPLAPVALAQRVRIEIDDRPRRGFQGLAHDVLRTLPSSKRHSVAATQPLPLVPPLGQSARAFHRRGLRLAWKHAMISTPESLSRKKSP